MSAKDVFRCFLLSLIVVICTARDNPFDLSDIRTSDEGVAASLTDTDRIVTLQGVKKKVGNKHDSKDNVAREKSDEKPDDATEIENNYTKVADKSDEKPDDANKIDYDTKDDSADINKNTIDVDKINYIGKHDTSASNENNLLLQTPSEDNGVITQNNYKLTKFEVKYGTKKTKLPGFKLSPSERTKFKIWPEGIIPFYIDKFSFGKLLCDKIRDYLDQTGSLTGLRFQELGHGIKGNEERYVFFVNRRGQLECKDYSTKSFTNSGAQRVVLGYDCLNNNGPMAAIVLALVGVPPQHNSPDRDRYVNVSMESVVPDKRWLFKRLNDGDWLFHDLPYDYTSAGHYSSYIYTADGSATITPINGRFDRGIKLVSIEENSDYSNMDLLKIRMLYNYILQNSQQSVIKIHKCNEFVRATSSESLKFEKPQKLLDRPKPKKYLNAVANEHSGDPLILLKKERLRGEMLSELEEIKD